MDFQCLHFKMLGDSSPLVPRKKLLGFFLSILPAVGLQVVSERVS